MEMRGKVDRGISDRQRRQEGDWLGSPSPLTDWPLAHWGAGLPFLPQVLLLLALGGRGTPGRVDTPVLPVLALGPGMPLPLPPGPHLPRIAPDGWKRPGW